jgi:hypothetical protein
MISQMASEIIRRLRRLSFVPMLLLAGCFYPPMTQPQPESHDQAMIVVPYDLVWDSVLAVIKKNQYKISAQDPTHGIVEAQSAHFTLQDADCGVIGTAAGKVAAEPAPDASAVFNFYVAASGKEASTLTVHAVFSTPVRVPFKTVQHMECTSRGIQEARLLREIKDVASHATRPSFTHGGSTSDGDGFKIKSDSFKLAPDSIKVSPDTIRKSPN